MGRTYYALNGYFLRTFSEFLGHFSFLWKDFKKRENVKITRVGSNFQVNGANEIPKPENVGYKIMFDILAEVEQTKSKFRSFLKKVATVTKKQQERDERTITT